MSYFSEELERQLDLAGLSVYAVAEKSGISPGQIYLWKRGDQTSIDENQLKQLAPVLSRDVTDHASLVRAHLMDEKFGPGHKLVHVEVDAEALHDKPRQLTKREQALEFLSANTRTNRASRDLIIELARCLGAKI